MEQLFRPRSVLLGVASLSRCLLHPCRFVVFFRLPALWNNFSGPVACFWVLPPFPILIACAASLPFCRPPPFFLGGGSTFRRTSFSSFSSFTSLKSTCQNEQNVGSPPPPPLRLLFSGRAAGCYSWLCSSAGLGRVSLHCHLAQAPAVPHITHPRATLSKQPQYKKHGKTFEKQPGAPSGPEKFVPKLWEPFSNKLQQHLDHFRTTSNLQFLLLCWDFEPCSNRFEPGSNRMESAIPITMLGCRPVVKPRSN